MVWISFPNALIDVKQEAKQNTAQVDNVRKLFRMKCLRSDLDCVAIGLAVPVLHSPADDSRWAKDLLRPVFKSLHMKASMDGRVDLEM